MEERSKVERLLALSVYFNWIAAICVLMLEKKNWYVRFHAIQSLILAVAIYVLSCTFVVPILGMVFAIIAMVKCYQGQDYEVPLIGGLAKSWTKVEP